MGSRADLETVVDEGASLGEGPVWDGARRSLVWVDIMAHEVHRLDPVTGRDAALDVGQPVGAVAPRSAGGLVLALRDGFALLGDDDGSLSWIAEIEKDNPANRMNDGACDSAGRFWAGTMAFESTPGAGALYRLDVDHRVEKVLEGVTISNGIAWSLDDTKMYFIDTPTQGIDVFDYDPETGAIGERRRAFHIEPDAGAPDGMTMDAEGCLWVALYGGGAVRRYTTEGKLLDVVELPTAHITSCTFGGDDLGDLYITSASQELSTAQLNAQPHAGALFRCRPGVTGTPVRAYAG
jgi:sugar lactone lactonase YvrE